MNRQNSQPVHVMNANNPHLNLNPNLPLARIDAYGLMVTKLLVRYHNMNQDYTFSTSILYCLQWRWITVLPHLMSRWLWTLEHTWKRNLWTYTTHISPKKIIQLLNKKCYEDVNIDEISYPYAKHLNQSINWHKTSPWGINTEFSLSLSYSFVETVMTWHCFCFVRVGKADGEDKTPWSSSERRKWGASTTSWHRSIRCQWRKRWDIFWKGLWKWEDGERERGVDLLFLPSHLHTVDCVRWITVGMYCFFMWYDMRCVCVCMCVCVLTDYVDRLLSIMR